MLEELNDPTLLFTPVKTGTPSVQSSALTELPDSPTPAAGPVVARAERERNAFCFVELPRISSQEKAKYKENEISDYESDADEVVELVGEREFGDKLYLFAMHRDGIVRRKEAWEYKDSFPDLYETYIKRQKEGSLDSFDPSASIVHPRDRIGLVISLPGKNNRSRHAIEYKDDSEETTESSEGEEEDDDYGGNRARRKGMKAKRQSTRILPFSPVKTRTRTGARSAANNVVEDSDESDAEHAPSRRSKRKLSRKDYTVNEDSDFEMGDSSSGGESSRRSKSKKPVKRRRGPKPAYGCIRDVTDTYDSDPETAPLRAHRNICERCRRRPTHILQKNKKKRRKRTSDDLSDEEENDVSTLGGWVRCLKCSVAAHWSCLAKTQRDEIIKAARAKADAELKDGDEPTERFVELEVDRSTEFVCGSCAKGGSCMCCKKVALEPETSNVESETRKQTDTETSVKTLGSEAPQESLFRCSTCKRIAHYSCLPVKDNEGLEPAEIATVYQKDNDWQCADCVSYTFPLDKIIAWRSSSSDTVDPYANSKAIPNIKENLPREYLVKWVGRSYRRTEWVPHMWLATTNPARLKNFYAIGPRIELLDAPIEEGGQFHRNDEESTTILLASAEGSRDASVEAETRNRPAEGPPEALPDAKLRIPPLWMTIDRVLDVLLWIPGARSKVGKREKGDDEVEETDDDKLSADSALRDTYELGTEPPEEFTETVEDFERRERRKIGSEEIKLVVWAFIKWDDLPYDEATWDSPPRLGTPGYTAFEQAFEKFLLSRSVTVRKKSGKEIEKFESRDGQKQWSSDYLGVPEGGKYDIGQKGNLSLMPFQVNGVNWLCRNWFHHQQCILADEMGLGKTVQIVTFLGILEAKLQVFPALVVVPNSTITNWVREFERWAPRLRVVPFYGDLRSREIVKKYELSHSYPAAGTTGAKYHVLITTYETVTGPKDFAPVFKKNPRWEVLVVDEGQRLKSDTNMLFRRLNELNSCHRIIMTGTPLNNNIRELFNLMNFLDPDDWSDLEGLTKEFEVLNEDLIKELHERLRPYFLRRVKAEVLDLPPKNEVIVPLSMAPLQKEIYKSILSKNLDILRGLTANASSHRVNKNVANKSNLRNMLMQLRKCLQHPYLISNDIEPKGLSPEETHDKLISASGKLRFLKLLLPKLKERGHRVLLFSQFVIGLNIVEDFLQGEGYKFLRLDGDIKQAERQKGMDEFNREGSDIFIYILSTRAGGVGINLWSADTVIIYDPDFNPHQDLQAIARAHRFGQKKTCLVFKFMTKDSAEERIIQAGKKKLVLDHLIVQKINDDEDGNDIQSMLTFGAKALFDESEQENRDITYNEQDVEKLIEKTELEGDQTETTEASNNAFAFAKVWSSHKDALDEIPDEVSDDIQDDSWAQTLAKIQEEQKREQAQEKSGRGVRRKAAQLKTSYFDDIVSPDKLAPKGKKRRRSVDSEGSDGEFKLRVHEKISEDEDEEMAELSNLDQVPDDILVVSDVIKQNSAVHRNHPSNPSLARAARPLSPIQNMQKEEECALCFTVHGKDGCFMTQKSENLLEYRRMLFENSDDEAYEDRVDAITSIDETLMKRGHSHLIAGLPIKPVKRHNKLSNFMSLINEKASESQQGRKTTARKTPRVSEKPVESARARTPSSGPSTSGLTRFIPFVDRRSIQAANTQSAPQPEAGLITNPSSANRTSGLQGTCEICDRSPYHIPDKCPVVALGPGSVVKALTRLTREGGRQDTLRTLHSILRKQKKVIEASQAVHRA